ncbi:MAG: hypothetical protein ACR2QC_00605 [Gammaproteobacteria bacterium]
MASTQKSHSHPPPRPIPAKAGISGAVGAKFPAALRRRRFLPSQEWN